jgi:hypothetical protein
MADSTGIGKVLSDITQAYLNSLSKIGGAIGDLAKSRMPDANRRTEHWIGVARAAKDGYVAAIDEGFALWERRIRESIAGATPTSAEKDTTGHPKPATNPFEGWLEEWRKGNEAFMQSIRDSGLGEEAVKQTKELRKAFDDGLKNLQKLWQPSSKSGGK